MRPLAFYFDKPLVSPLLIGYIINGSNIVLTGFVHLNFLHY